MTMTPNEIRESYLRFFEERGHTRMPSDSLVPANDPSLLFTGAGMNQFKEEFLGRGKRGLRRATTSQKCFRAGDLDNVGRTRGHHTFFEMLGNFSFGDYFKQDAIRWAWEYLTTVLRLDGAHLHVTVYKDDDEAYGHWRNGVGLPPERIDRLGAKSNFWPANAPEDGPNGPCGPCSEIFWDYGPQPGCPAAPAACDPSCDCGRFFEVWNLVFTQFDRRDGGELVPLPQKNIDTGSGFERLVMVKEGVGRTLDTSIFTPLREGIARAAGRQHYDAAGEDGVRMRRIADHVRAACFLVGDGVRPSNEGRGYVLRRILRRAIRDGSMLGIDRPFLAELVPAVAESMGEAYPDLRSGVELLAGVVAAEEAQFRRTFASGMARLDAAIGQIAPGTTEFPAETVFLLHDTYGFPSEITGEILGERGLKFDSARFDALMEEQRDRARGARKMTADIFDGGPLAHLSRSGVAATEFLGYEELPGAERRGTYARATLRGIVHVQAAKLSDDLAPGAEASLVLDRTPFYAESGGQSGDAGEIRFPGGVFQVKDTTGSSGYHLHHGVWTGSESLHVGTACEAVVDEARRDAIRRNHTGTHVLHKALKQVLGDRVNQAGSLVAPERLRFDFTFDRGMTSQEIQAVEDLVNAEILRNDPVTKAAVPLEEAKRSGAMALFGEKYPDPVRVVATGDYSKELCGGTHCLRTGDIGSLRIVSEGSIASGIRRVEAVTGVEAVRRMQDDRDQLTSLSRALGVPPREIAARIEKLQGEIKQLRKRPAAGPSFDPASGDPVVAGGLRVFVHVVEISRDDVDAALGTFAKKPGDPSAALVVTTDGGKVSALVAANAGAVEGGFDAAAFIRATGGRGGGKKHAAQGTYPGEPTIDDLRSKVAAALGAK